MTVTPLTATPGHGPGGGTEQGAGQLDRVKSQVLCLPTLNMHIAFTHFDTADVVRNRWP